MIFFLFFRRNSWSPYIKILAPPLSIFFACRKVMLRVDAKQGSPKDGNSILELFQVITHSFFFQMVSSHRISCKHMMLYGDLFCLK